MLAGMALFLRYVLAVIVAFTASVAAMFLLVTLAESLRLSSSGSVFDWIVPMVFNGLIGFAGVFLGAFCFPRPSRVVGAAVLVLLGFSFEITLLMLVLPTEDRFPSGSIVTGVGGLAAVALHYWLGMANHALQPTPLTRRG